jgi:vancomycin permeability regulator SanA
LARATRRRLPVLRVFALIVCLAALGVGVIAGPALWTRWMSRDRILTSVHAPTRDVAIIYGAEVYPSGKPSPYLRARLDLGAALFRAGRVRVLIVSGDNAVSHNREATSMKNYLVSVGVPEARIVEDAFGLDTYDTCVRAHDVFGVTSALLVSQRYHLPRAVATCRAVGVDADRGRGRHGPAHLQALGRVRPARTGRQREDGRRPPDTAQSRAGAALGRRRRGAALLSRALRGALGWVR